MVLKWEVKCLFDPGISICVGREDNGQPNKYREISHLTKKSLIMNAIKVLKLSFWAFLVAWFATFYKLCFLPFLNNFKLESILQLSIICSNGKTPKFTRKLNAEHNRSS